MTKLQREVVTPSSTTTVPHPQHLAPDTRSGNKALSKPHPIHTPTPNHPSQRGRGGHERIALKSYCVQFYSRNRQSSPTPWSRHLKREQGVSKATMSPPSASVVEGRGLHERIAVKSHCVEFNNHDPPTISNVLVPSIARAWFNTSKC